MKGCGAVVWGDEEVGTLNCGDKIGRWKVDKDGIREWVWTEDKFMCDKCSQKTSKESDK